MVVQRDLQHTVASFFVAMFALTVANLFVTRKTTNFSARYSAICLLLNASLHECLRVKVKMSVCTHVRICFSGKIIYRELNFKDLLSHHCKQPLFVQAGFREATGYRFARASKLRGIM